MGAEGDAWKKTTRFIVIWMRVASAAVVCMWLMMACGTTAELLAIVPPQEVDIRTLPPISLPRDDGSHDNLTEWWYVTGHLETVEGGQVGFEFVIFKSMRTGAPTGYAAHFAITDVGSGSFDYAERAAAVTSVVGGEELNLCVGDWILRRVPGGIAIEASSPENSLQLELIPMKPAALHNDTGLLDFSPFGWSYYYSYPRVKARGVWIDSGLVRPVEGIAWIDHQWGDFISVGTGGWDWFSIQLDDGRDFTASIVRDDGGATVMKYGTIIDAGGASRHLEAHEFSLDATGSWVSPHSGATYPSGWIIHVPGDALTMHVHPLVEDQELDTRSSTGVIYWEGAVSVSDRGNRTGHGYVELTGYARPPVMSPVTSARGAPEDTC